jgi:hypothetical protein
MNMQENLPAFFADHGIAILLKEIVNIGCGA